MHGKKNISNLLVTLMCLMVKRKAITVKVCTAGLAGEKPIIAKKKHCKAFFFLLVQTLYTLSKVSHIIKNLSRV